MVVRSTHIDIVLSFYSWVACLATALHMVGTSGLRVTVYDFVS